MVLYLWKTWIPFTQVCFMPFSLVEISPNVLKKFKCCQIISALLLLSPLWKGHDHSFEQSWVPFNQGWLVSSLVKMAIGRYCIVCYCVNISPWKRVWSIIWSLVEIGPVVVEKYIFKFHQCIFTILLLEGATLHLNKHESPISFTHRSFQPSLAVFLV